MKILYWGLGIFILLILIVSITVKIGSFIFDKNSEKEIEKLFNKVNLKADIFTKKDLAGLPQPVKNWLHYSQVIGKEKITTVRLKQKGLMRLEMDQSGMPTEAEQYFTVDQPGFIWEAKVKMAPFVFFKGRDKYYQGTGEMLIKLMSLIPVVNDKGEKMNQGTLLRYLGEIIWFPTAAISDYIEWEMIDKNSARAIMSYGNITESAIFYFSDNGRPIKFTCQRYMATNDKMETYKAIVNDIKEFEGIRIPASGEAIWKLEKGDFSYYEFELTDVEYNQPS